MKATALTIAAVTAAAAVGVAVVVAVSARGEGPGPVAPAVGEPAPPEPATAHWEPSAEDLEQILVERDPGTLEVLVLDGRTPVAGARVFAAGQETATDGRGLAQVRDVADGRHDVRVLHPPFAVQQVSVVHSPSGRDRVVVVFGGSALRGVVWDASGAPLESCRVVAETESPHYPGQTLRAWTTTARDGSYLIDGLIAGRYQVTRDGARGQPAIEVELAPGAEALASFGVPNGLPQWTGTVRDVRGQAVRGPGWIETECRESGVMSGFPYDEMGHFRAALIPGTYYARMRTWVGLQTLAIARIDGGGVDADPVVPGTRVVVRISYGGSWSDQETVAGRLRVWLFAEPDGDGQRANLGSGTSRTFLGVPPGEYSLECWPNPILGSNDGRWPLRVAADQACVVIDVSVGDP